MEVTLYHNPSCSTSRKALEMLRERGIEPTIVPYLKQPPVRDELVALLALLGMRPRQLIRTKGDLYAELGLAEDKWSDGELISMLARHPALIERPIVVTKLGARVGRPVEKILEVLPA